MERKYTCIAINKENFWKLTELKVKLRCPTWDDFIKKIYPILIENLEKMKDDYSTSKTSDRK